MIEEGFFNNRISHDIIAQYLQDPILEGIDALILACTHYPLIRKEIAAFYSNKVKILDSSVIVAEALREYLSTNDLLATHQSTENHFFVSDFTEAFEASTRTFFGEHVSLERHALWS